MDKTKFAEIRKRLGWSQRQLARRLKLSNSTVCLIESGDRPIRDYLAEKMVKLEDVAVTLETITFTEGE